MARGSLSITIDLEEARKLNELARASGLTMSALVQRAVRLLLEQESGTAHDERGEARDETRPTAR